MDKNTIRSILETNNYQIVLEKRYKNYGYRLKTSTGTTVTCYDKGTYYCQGKNASALKHLLDENISTPIFNNKVFVVYGHDELARQELENLLLQWHLEPLIIDQLPSEGRTIIEQLEKYIPQANFGIVLATPDDIGYDKNFENEKKFRARQNVVLELGMLLSKLGRSRVAVVTKNVSNLEKPSDIQGIIYHSYNENISEISSRLIRELNAKGYNIVA